MDLGKYDDLNLWLYQNEKNAKLEEELYQSKAKRSSARVGVRGAAAPASKR
jgi:hypothetical protein